jgi:hypothetical protein
VLQWYTYAAYMPRYYNKYSIDLNDSDYGVPLFRKQETGTGDTLKVSAYSLNLNRVHTYVDLYVTVMKFLLVIVFLFLQDSSFKGFKILVLVILSTVSFIRYWIDRPFYQNSHNRLMSVVHGIFAWTNYLILLGALLGDARFNMLLFIYLLGIPLIIALILTSRADAHMKVLLTPVSKF